LEEQYRKEKEEADQLFEQQRKVSSACWELTIEVKRTSNLLMAGMININESMF